MEIQDCYSDLVSAVFFYSPGAIDCFLPLLLLPPSRTSDPGSLRTLVSLLPTTICALRECSNFDDRFFPGGRY